MRTEYRWPASPWATTASTLCWWLRQWEVTDTLPSQRAVRAFWQIAVEELGEEAARAAVEAEGLALPDWLEEEAGEA